MAHLLVSGLRQWHKRQCGDWMQGDPPGLNSYKTRQHLTALWPALFCPRLNVSITLICHRLHSGYNDYLPIKLLHREKRIPLCGLVFNRPVVCKETQLFNGQEKYCEKPPKPTATQ